MLKNAPTRREHTDRLTTYELYCQLLPHPWGCRDSFTCQASSAFPEDDRLILQGALAPAPSALINLGKAWVTLLKARAGLAGWRALASFLCPPVTSHLRVGGGGAELVEISLFAEDICFEGSKDPGGTVLKAKQQRAITLPLLNQATRTEQC